jgi:hypothetical protein
VADLTPLPELLRVPYGDGAFAVEVTEAGRSAEGLRAHVHFRNGATDYNQVLSLGLRDT